MASKKPVIHGRDHLPGGADEIPQTAAGAWAIAYFSHAQGDAYQSIANTTFTSVPFAHFETTDTSVFTTGPGGVAGDTLLKVWAAGIYVCEMGSGWQTNFTQLALVDINAQTFHGPNWSHPANFHAFASTTPVRNSYHDTRVYPFTSADLGGSFAQIEVDAYQASGSAQNLDQMWLRVAYIPTGSSETAVY